MHVPPGPAEAECPSYDVEPEPCQWSGVVPFDASKSPFCTLLPRTSTCRLAVLFVSLDAATAPAGSTDADSSNTGGRTQRLQFTLTIERGTGASYCLVSIRQPDRKALELTDESIENRLTHQSTASPPWASDDSLLDLLDVAVVGGGPLEGPAGEDLLKGAVEDPRSEPARRRARECDERSTNRSDTTLSPAWRIARSIATHLRPYLTDASIKRWFGDFAVEFRPPREQAARPTSVGTSQ